jgi:hypothetical protein
VHCNAMRAPPAPVVQTSCLATRPVAVEAHGPWLTARQTDAALRCLSSAAPVARLRPREPPPQTTKHAPRTTSISVALRHQARPSGNWRPQTKELSFAHWRASYGPSQSVHRLLQERERAWPHIKPWWVRCGAVRVATQTSYTRARPAACCSPAAGLCRQTQQP